MGTHYILQLEISFWNEKIQIKSNRKARNQNEDLILHQIIHTSKQPFEYDKCGKTFKRAILITQKRVHSERKPNECNECIIGKPFLRGPPSSYITEFIQGETLYL